MAQHDTLNSAVETKSGSSDNDQDLMNQLSSWLREAEAAKSETNYRTESTEDMSFYAGDQDSQEVKNELIDKQRPNTTYNIILPKINMLTGLAAQSHRSPYAFPITSEDEAITEVMNGVLKHYRRRLDLQDMEVAAFDKAVKAGRSFLHIWVSKENPFKPTIKAKLIDGDQCWVDPSSTEYDLSDARFFFADEWFDKGTIKQRWGLSEEDFAQVTQTSSNMPSFFDSVKNLYRISQCWFYKYETMCWYKNVKGSIEKCSPAEFQKMTVQFQDMGMLAPEMRKSLTKVLYYAIFSGSKILETGRAPYKHNKIPYILFGAYKNDVENRWFSAINMMKDPQRGLNTIRRQLVHLLQTLPKGILVHEVGAVLNIDEYETRSSDPSFHLEVAKDAISKYKFEQQPQISPIYQSLDGMFNQSTKDVSGIQDSLMGEQTSSREAGVVVRLRQESGVAVLYVLFRGFRKSRINSCKMMLSLIQQYVTEQEIIRIEGAEGTKLLTINNQMNPELAGFNDVGALEYDIDIDEVADNATMRAAILDILMSFSQNNPGTIPPDLILEYSDLPLSAKQRVREYMDQQQALENKRFAIEQGIKMHQVLGQQKIADDQNAISAQQAVQAGKQNQGGSKNG